MLLSYFIYVNRFLFLSIVVYILCCECGGKLRGFLVVYTKNVDIFEWEETVDIDMDVWNLRWNFTIFELGVSLGSFKCNSLPVWCGNFCDRSIRGRRVVDWRLWQPSNWARHFAFFLICFDVVYTGLYLIICMFIHVFNHICLYIYINACFYVFLFIS